MGTEQLQKDTLAHTHPTMRIIGKLNPALGRWLVATATVITQELTQALPTLYSISTVMFT